MKKKHIFTLALSGILCAEAIALSFIEGLLPAIPFLPPGAKPGLSNIVTMFAASCIGLPEALLITLIKSLFVFVTRGAVAAAMSFSGGLLSTLAMYFLFRYAKNIFGIAGISVIGAFCHNAGQLITSVIISGSSKTLYYAPFLAGFSVVTGILTGVIFKAVYPALEKQKKYLLRNNQI